MKFKLRITKLKHVIKVKLDEIKITKLIKFYLITLRRYAVQSLNESDVSIRFVVFFTSLENIW